MNLNLTTFSSEYFAPALIILGLIGNLFGLIVITKKKLIKIGPQTAYIALFIYDWINFLLIAQPYAQFAFNIDITIFSLFSCKSYWYISYVLGPISPMLNVYISIERYISIVYPEKKHILLNNKTQLIYVIALTLFNLALYVPVGLKLNFVNEYNQTVCDYEDWTNGVSYWGSIIGYLDLTNHVILPSALLIIFTSLIIYTIFTTRRSRANSSNTRANRAFQKNVKFSLIIVILNMFYVLFSLPLLILLLFPNYLSSPFYVSFTFVYYLAYSCNFYLIFSVNSFFRGGFYSIFVCSAESNTNNNDNNNNAARL